MIETMKDKAKLLIHTPADLAAEHLAWARRNMAVPGIPWDVRSVDNWMIPMRPGDLVGVMGRPGHGKSSIMAYLARCEAKRIMERGTETTEAVVYVTWESSAEELENFFVADDKASASDVAWGRADIEYLEKKAVKRARVPIWVIGHGIGRASVDTPRMTVDVVYDAIESMQADYGVKPSLVLLDYVQIIPVAKANERTAQVTEAVIRAKELAQRAGVPIVAGVQARREVDTYKLPIPEKADAQWASGIEQTCDKLFGLWRPAISPGFENKLIEIEGCAAPVEVTQRLMILRMLKQRFEDGRFTWALHFAPQYLTLCELELRNHETRGWEA
jgi:replicative DNA helicase